MQVALSTLVPRWRRVTSVLGRQVGREHSDVLTILDLQYEDMVDDTEGQDRTLLDHCGLEWEDACLDFHRTERGVRTPSRWQVRQPIYRGSVQRWRNYEEELKPLREILAPILPSGDAA
jgi:hypothetical protein